VAYARETVDTIRDKKFISFTYSSSAKPTTRTCLKTKKANRPHGPVSKQENKLSSRFKDGIISPSVKKEKEEE